MSATGTSNEQTACGKHITHNFGCDMVVAGGYTERVEGVPSGNVLAGTGHHAHAFRRDMKHSPARR